MYRSSGSFAVYHLPQKETDNPNKNESANMRSSKQNTDRHKYVYFREAERGLNNAQCPSLRAREARIPHTVAAEHVLASN